MSAPSENGKEMASRASGSRAIDAVNAATYDKAIADLETQKNDDKMRFLSKEMPYEEHVAYVMHLNAELSKLNELQEWYTQCVAACGAARKAREQRDGAVHNLKRVRKKQKNLHAYLEQGL